MDVTSTFPSLTGLWTSWSPSTLLVGIGLLALVFFGLVAFYNLYLHPLAKYPGPWYAASTSLTLAVISWRKHEPYWLQGVVRKYGST